MAPIGDTTNKRYTVVDPTKREYYLNPPMRPRESTDASQTLVIEIEIRDTGEERQMFGHSARHFVTTQRREAEKRVMATDGWYVDLPVAVPNHSRIGSVTVLVDIHRGGALPKVKVTRSGPAIHGLPVWEKTAERLMEVTELSEAPLDQSLFEVPTGYRRVIRPQPGEQLSWGDRLLLFWQGFREWLSSSS